ncbi:hypothetical protein [Nostoc sp. FACHB-190]|uniref:hypothetical protein n=1 Tax=Nostoc sp. FACHB-190 TaxID=2692838 RepID=UPI001683ECED|nr:hypothetical protein [Nostoc sp. FACHB-190]MBD2298933.1 hypothetical protein [Nostoc sp. FACHB-190]
MFTVAQIHQAKDVLEYARSRRQLHFFCRTLASWGYPSLGVKATERELREHIQQFISEAAVALNNSEKVAAA